MARTPAAARSARYGPRSPPAGPFALAAPSRPSLLRVRRTGRTSPSRPSSSPSGRPSPSRSPRRPGPRRRHARGRAQVDGGADARRALVEANETGAPLRRRRRVVRGLGRDPKDAAIENLGELFVSGARGEAAFSTSRRDFGLMVTAEPFPLVTRPSDVVVFTGGAPSPGKALSEPISFGRFSADAKPATPSIASLEWTSAEPVELSQARAIVEMAEREKSGDPDRRLTREARVALSQAERSPARRKPEGRRRPGTPCRGARFGGAPRGGAAEGGRRGGPARSGKAGPGGGEQGRRGRRGATGAVRRSPRSQRSRSCGRRRRSNWSGRASPPRRSPPPARSSRRSAAGSCEEREALRRERDALAAGLADALETVAPTLETARGLVVTLPGSSFDPGKSAPRAAGTRHHREARGNPPDAPGAQRPDRGLHGLPPGTPPRTASSPRIAPGTSRASSATRGFRRRGSPSRATVPRTPSPRTRLPTGAP